MITLFNEIKNSEIDTNDLEGWVPISGNPTMKTQILHTNRENKMISGIWEATPGTYHATYSSYEFVHMIKGKIKITPDDGSPSKIVKTGDSFVVESNFKGTWEILSPVLKHFDFVI
ncbi:MAG: hypothetical protein CML58_04900 [Rhodobacteraceae bacterium]|nr:hypothetical protein [Paracoccaceae bacterium]RZO34367.1 MAG: DUF861 domain-containing protein [Paracoccaceae bacterium]|tara:strand:- start:415 stop:762 length:348 start_codon:yes stop_codon:yes gene_type:complete